MGNHGSGITSIAGNYFGYDQMGRTNTHRQITGSGTYATSYAYNLASELLSETYHSGRVMSYAYDDGGRLSKVVDATNNPGNPNDPNNVVFDNSFSYAPHGGLLSETFGNSATHSLNYNRALQASQVKLAINGAEKQRYDYAYGVVNQGTGSVDTTKNNGQLARVDATINGWQTKEWDQRFVYDALGRLATGAEYKQGDNAQLTWQAHYDYDRFGNRFQYQNNVNVNYTQVQSSEFDPSRNRFVANGQTPTTYDSAGNIVTDTKFRGMNFTYDANDRQTFTEHTDHTSQQTSVYDCGGQRVQTTAGGGTRTAVYDIFGQNIADYSNGSVERENIYRGGQLLATQEYAQIVTQNVSWTNMVGVSASGNNLTKTAANGWGNGGAVSTQAIAFGDGYAEFGTGSLDYGMYGLSHSDTDQGYPDIDYAFYTERDGGRVYVYENGVYRTQVGNFVDGDHLRVAVEGGVVKYRKNGTLLYTSTVAPTYPLLVDTSLYSSNNTLTNVVISGNLGSAGLKYVLQDIQGSTRVVMNNIGGSSAIIARHDYLPFGEEISSGTGLRTGAQGYNAPDANRQKYGMLERDDTTGLDHVWWRKYESLSGRWTSPDPDASSASVGDPQSLNRYSYVQNDPINRIDPTGLCLFVIFRAWINDKHKVVDIYPILCGEGITSGGGVMGQESHPPGRPAQKETSDDCRKKALEELAQELGARQEQFASDSFKLVKMLWTAGAGSAFGLRNGGPVGAVLGTGIGAGVGAYLNDSAEMNIEQGPVMRFKQKAARCDKMAKRERAQKKKEGNSMQAQGPPQILVITRQFGTFALYPYTIKTGPTILNDYVYQHHGANPGDPVTTNFGP